MRIEYVCNGYHRFGKEACTDHRINESTLDKLIHDELLLIKSLADKNWNSIEGDVKRWLKKKNDTAEKISDLEMRIRSINMQIEQILMERIEDKENRVTYDSMLEKRKEEKAKCTAQIESLKSIDETIKKRRDEIKESIDLIDQIIGSGGISDAHLRMLVDEITIGEDENGLDISIVIKAPFRQHIDIYGKDGEIVDRFFESWVFSA